MPEQDLDIDIHLPKNEQIPTHLYKRYDNHYDWIDPMVRVTCVGIAFIVSQFLGVLIKAYIWTRLMWWALFLIAIASCGVVFCPRKYRLLYLIGLFVSVAVGTLW